MRKKIGELLLESGVINPEQIRKALGKQQRTRARGVRLGSVIVTLGFASLPEVAKALARQANLPFVELPEIPPEVRALVPLEFQIEHRLVPFRLEREGRGERLHVAVDDPSDLRPVEELSFQLNKPIRVHVAAEDDLDRVLELVSGRVVDGLEEDEDEPLEMEHGGRADASLLDWEPPVSAMTRPPPPPLPDDDEDITLITPRAATKARNTLLPPPPPPQENGDVLDELLGGSVREADDAAPGQESRKGVPVVVFGGAAKGTPLPPPRPELPDISEEDLKVLEELERMADGAEAQLHTEKVKPARMVASLIRLLIRKRLIHEEEFLEELSRK
ncbi:ATPase [Cystobacter fuscus]|uniref:ATPase n=1 Tax=Cystobacter fuscus TaxID=43 RepID=A0A250JAW7_9BACT|nr:general secretion pathway protein GspE [Cystobacter fuscus]ATB40612.1 ATPase [Cystobacter fuscus]